jgi:hypothetical protein
MRDAESDYETAKRAYARAQSKLRKAKAAVQAERVTALAARPAKAWEMYLDGERDMDVIADATDWNPGGVQRFIDRKLKAGQFGPETYKQFERQKAVQDTDIRREREFQYFLLNSTLQRLAATRRNEERLAELARRPAGVIRDMTEGELAVFWTPESMDMHGDVVRDALARMADALDTNPRCKMCRPYIDDR